ncbi:MAG: Maf family protein [Bacteroidales bacterium]|jgi:septum formation protein|nr:Maf family protein [Bacteroidales bacterium]
MLWNKLKNHKIYLASQSPRRKELLKGLNIDFEIIVFDCEERYPPNIPYYKIAEYISEQKASACPKENLADNFILITADTTVCIDNDILGKPKDETKAIEMLRQLSGKKHEVITGVSLLTKSLRKTFSVKTDVYFKSLSEKEIEFYVKNYWPLDKAGAYGIQEWIGFAGITRIDGSYFNVMGLPVQRLYEELSMLAQ